jgi:glutaminase
LRAAGQSVARDEVMNDLTRTRAESIDIQEAVDQALLDVSAYQGQGQLPSYIPTLAQVNPRKLGLAVALGDGSSFAAGDADEPFSIQSIANVFTLSLALQHVGTTLWNHVGKEASGSPINSLVQLELEKGKPRNPLINAGALVVDDHLIGGDSPDAAVQELLEFLRDRCGDECVMIDEKVALSESQAGSLNRSLAHFIAAFGNLTHPAEDVVTVYFRQCAISMSCRLLARAGLYLAFDGMDPVSGDQVILPNRCRRILSLMMTCGHYDNSGDFAFRIGLPGKSSVGGGILAIVPKVGAIATWSPGLNASGTSLAGSALLEKLVERTGWSVFA